MLCRDFATNFILLSFQAMTSFYGAGKHFPAFLMKSNPIPALHVLKRAIHSLDFPLPSLHHPSTSSGRNFPASLPEKSELSWTFTPNRNCAATALIIISSSEDREINLAMKIKKTWKKDVAELKTRQKEGKWQAMNLKDPLQSKIQKTPKGFRKQLSLKAASSKDANRVYVQGQPLLATNKNKGSIYRSQYAIKPAPDNEIEYFSKTLYTKEAELHSLQGERKAENQNRNREKNGNREENYYDAAAETLPSDVRQETFIMLIPHAEMKTQAEPSKAENTEMRWETIKDQGDPPSFIKSLKDFISKTDKSKWKCFVGQTSLLKLYIIDTVEMTDLKLAKKASEVTTISAATEKTEAATENVSFTTTEEANTTAEESVIPSPPSLKAMKPEATTAGFLTEATTVKMEIQDATEVFSQSNTTEIQPSRDQRQTTLPDPEPETDFEPKLGTTHNGPVTSKVQFSGLRMRDDVLPKKLDKDTENIKEVFENWTVDDIKHGLVHRGGEAQTFSKSSEDIQKKDADKEPKVNETSNNHELRSPTDV